MMVKLIYSDNHVDHYEMSKRLLRYTRGGDGSHWEGCEEVHWDCRIAQLKAELARLNAERRWIPVSERLPEIHDDYDGEKSDCCYAIDIHKCVWIAYYRPDEKDWYELPAGIILTTITHWMPLPEPPEGDRC